MFSNIDLSNPWLVGAGLNMVLLGLTSLMPKKLLTPAGLINAWLLGVIIWATLGWQGYVVIVFYFVVGSGVTRVGLAEKEAEGIAEKRSGARGPENVWGSALTGTICALGTLLVDESAQDLLLLGYVASLSTKLADTCASEIGKAYGKSTFLITTLQPVARGTEGAVSLEGTIAGVIASVALAMVGWGIGLISPLGILWAVIAAFVATNLESVIGATLQNKFAWLTNEVVNVINTIIGALVAILLGVIWVRWF